MAHSEKRLQAESWFIIFSVCPARIAQPKVPGLGSRAKTAIGCRVAGLAGGWPLKAGWSRGQCGSKQLMNKFGFIVQINLMIFILGAPYDF
ncbi:MAG TPA: hypothetical protein ACFCUD_11100 [Cyclobacteriaceae bacterium]